MGKDIGLPIGNTTIQVLIHKDNDGALILTATLPIATLIHILKQALPLRNYIASRKYS